MAFFLSRVCAVARTTAVTRSAFAPMAIRGLCTDMPVEGEKSTGTVKWFGSKGYGFITGADGTSRKIHRTIDAPARPTDNRSWC